MSSCVKLNCCVSVSAFCNILLMSQKKICKFMSSCVKLNCCVGVSACCNILLVSQKKICQFLSSCVKLDCCVGVSACCNILLVSQKKIRKFMSSCVKLILDYYCIDLENIPPKPFFCDDISTLIWWFTSACGLKSVLWNRVLETL